jgi:hypothetical protein
LQLIINNNNTKHIDKNNYRDVQLIIPRDEILNIHLHLAYPGQRNRSGLYMRRHKIDETERDIGPDNPLRSREEPPKLTIRDHIAQMKNLQINRIRSETEVVPTTIAVPISDLAANLLRPCYHRNGLGSKRIFFFEDEPIEQRNYWGLVFADDHEMTQSNTLYWMDFNFNLEEDRINLLDQNQIKNSDVIWGAAMVPLVKNGKIIPINDIAGYDYDLRHIFGRNAHDLIQLAYEDWPANWQSRIDELVKQYQQNNHPFEKYYHSLICQDKDQNYTVIQRYGSFPELAHQMGDAGIIHAGLLDSGGSCAIYDAWLKSYLNHSWYFREARGAILVFELKSIDLLPDYGFNSRLSFHKNIQGGSK